MSSLRGAGQRPLQPSPSSRSTPALSQLPIHRWLLGATKVRQKQNPEQGARPTPSLPLFPQTPAQPKSRKKTLDPQCSELSSRSRHQGGRPPRRPEPMHHAPVASDAKHTVAVFASKGARLRSSVTDGGYSHHCLPARSLSISQIIGQRNRTKPFPASLKEMPRSQWAAHARAGSAGMATKERFIFPPAKHAPPRKLQIPTTQKGTEQLRADRLRPQGPRRSVNLGP